jgi:DNA ligase-1
VTVELKKPMLAVQVEDTSKVKYPVWASVKLDGLRCLIKDGVVYSRSMKPIPSKAVQELFGKSEYQGCDGELIYGDMNDPLVFNKSTSFCMSKEVPEGMEKSQIRYFVFDKWDEQGNWEDRISKVNTGWSETSQVHRLRHHLIEDEDTLLELEANVLANGAEGLILRSIEGRYKQGRSTAKEGLLLKLKRFQNSECTVIGFEEKMHNANEAKVSNTGHTERSSHKENLVPVNTLGALVVTAEPWGEFRIGTGFYDEQRKDIWENKEKYVGQLVSFDHFTVGALDKPRFPSFKGFRWEGDV